METLLITGANRGIGLAHARRFAERGCKVFAAARDLKGATDLTELTAQYRDSVTLIPYDAADPAAPEAVAAALKGVSLDLLFANAGVMGAHARLGGIERAEVLETFQINALAPLMLAQALAENVARSTRKRIAFQSTLMGSIGDNSSGGAYAYRMSKAALNMAARSVAHDLRPRGVIAVALHPGWVQTRMGGPSAPVTLDACVDGQQRLIAALTPEYSGRFFNYDGRELPW